MKKIKKIILSLLLLPCVFMLSGCFTQKSITADQFKNIMEKNGYEVIESTDQYKEIMKVKKSYIALYKNRKFQFELIEFDTIEEAIKIYEINKQKFEEKKSNVANMYINLDGKNFSKYRCISGGKYMALTRVNNTLMYVDVNQEYEKEVNKAIKKFGY